MTDSNRSALKSDVPWSPPVATGSALLEAWRAQRTHPVVLWFGPVFGVMEQVEAGWRMSAMADPTPQASRDGLGSWFRLVARRRSTSDAAREEFWEASALLERERPDELMVAGRRFRVVRADQFYRYGLTGPEPPRATDPDTEPGEDRAAAYEKLTGCLLGPAETPGGKALLGQRWEAVPEGPMVPADVTREAHEALTTHPRVAMLPARFAVAEERDGHWPSQTEATRSPRAAREALAAYFDKIVPMIMRPSRKELASYQEAAKLLAREPVNQLVAAGRRFRIIRVETAVRVGPDGPEPPRPSDFDPDPPVTGETEELRGGPLIEDR